jgi:hypothetical protein
MTTTVVYATDLYSGSNYGYSGTYSTARSTRTTSIGNPSFVGQQAGYYCYQGPLMFNTSVIGTDVISSAVLGIWHVASYLDSNFTVQARAISSYGSLAASWVAGASLSGNTLLAHIDTSGIGAAGSYKALVDDAMPANINKSGTTYLLVSSSKQASGTAPTNNEAISYYDAARTGTTNDPKLTVTHAAAGFAYSQAVVIA